MRVVTFDYDHISVTGADAPSPAREIVELRDRAGAAGGLRTYRNSVVFVVADVAAVEDLKDRVRTRLALDNLISEPTRLATFADEMKAKVRAMHDDSGLNARIAVTRCYKHVYYPVKDASSNNLEPRVSAQKGWG